MSAKTQFLPPDWDSLYPTLPDQWQQVAHELAEFLLDMDVELNQSEPMRHYHAVARRQNIAAIQALLAANPTQNPRHER